MLMMLSEPKGKLDAMTGYSFSTPVWDGRAWVRAVPAGDKAAPVAVMAEVPRQANGPEGMPDWDAVDWRVHEGNVRRLRQRIFKASREQDWPKVRSLQKMMVRHEALVFPDGGGRPRSLRRRSGGDEAGGSLNRGSPGRAGAASTKSRRFSTAGWAGRGERDGKVYERNRLRYAS
jgi:hypothetical protein